MRRRLAQQAGQERGRGGAGHAAQGKQARGGGVFQKTHAAAVLDAQEWSCKGPKGVEEMAWGAMERAAAAGAWPAPT